MGITIPLPPLTATFACNGTALLLVVTMLPLHVVAQLTCQYY